MIKSLWNKMKEDFLLSSWKRLTWCVLFLLIIIATLELVDLWTNSWKLVQNDFKFGPVPDFLNFRSSRIKSGWVKKLDEHLTMLSPFLYSIVTCFAQSINVYCSTVKCIWLIFHHLSLVTVVRVGAWRCFEVCVTPLRPCKQLFYYCCVSNVVDCIDYVGR